MNYDELFELVSKMKEIKGEECLICHFPIEKETDITKLSCSHIYHTECISKIKTFNLIVCPYCQRSTNINKIRKPEIKCKSIIKTGVNKGKSCDKFSCKKHKELQPQTVCNTIIKTGVRKSLPCNRNNCKIHTIII